MNSQVVHNEIIKNRCPTLAGTIAQTLANPDLDRFSEDDSQFLKFHGIYQQDDRDLRKTAKKYIFMVRARLPGGVVPPDLYLAFDRLASLHGNQTLRITSRQGFQFHGVVKHQLGPLMRAIHDALTTTLAACGDVNRNVMAPPTPAVDSVGTAVLEDARRVSDALLPRTRAYHAIWIDGTQLDLGSPENQDYADPLYGRTYLPRKFKTAFAIPPLNDTDVLTNCLGFIAIVENGRLVGYNLTAGGGMGMSHGNAETYPRVADVIGFVPPDRVVDAAKAVLTTYRDYGDRTNRKHARLKYVLEERGVAWFRAEVEGRLGVRLGEARPFQFERQGDLLGWHSQADGRWFLGLYVEAGRIRDQGDSRLKSALRQIVRELRPEIRLTPAQNLLLVNIAATDRGTIDQVLAAHGILVGSQAGPTRQAALACVALPTCGLALAESERYLPAFMTRLESVLAELGLAQETITVRMTGCPNGCVRPFMAEIGIVGKAPGRYQIHLGGNTASTRLNRLYREAVREADLVPELRVVLARYAEERVRGEGFGDWVARALWPETAGGASPVN